VITALLPKTKFSSTYFCNDIIPKIVEEMPFDLAKSHRKLMLHTDNATPHCGHPTRECLKKFRIPRILHLPDSSGLAPSDLYLFEKLDRVFAGREFVSTEELLLAINEITASIERAELESVVDAWKRRLDKCIQIKHEYVS
jgi:transposase InsO family protein